MPTDDIFIELQEEPVSVVLDIPGPLEYVTVVPGADGQPGPPGAQGVQGVQGVQGIQGIPGAPGVDGDKYFRHIQDIPTLTATIAHGLNKYPSVTIIDTGENQIEATITYVDINTVTVEITALSAWTAFFN